MKRGSIHIRHFQIEPDLTPLKHLTMPQTAWKISFLCSDGTMVSWSCRDRNNQFDSIVDGLSHVFSRWVWLLFLHGLCETCVVVCIWWFVREDMKELMPDVHKTFHHFTGRIEDAWAGWAERNTWSRYCLKSLLRSHHMLSTQRQVYSTHMFPQILKGIYQTISHFLDDSSSICKW